MRELDEKDIDRIIKEGFENDMPDLSDSFTFDVMGRIEHLESTESGAFNKWEKISIVMFLISFFVLTVVLMHFGVLHKFDLSFVNNVVSGIKGFSSFINFSFIACFGIGLLLLLDKISLKISDKSR
ncbi:hypothetical protein [Aureibacter tunicatorum]|uniref:Uncharacterized protein n=1 Tax=Aureibacter tunicatorum TaxID=866807 RepID=A0AAE3XQJ7_9BACT|nr:hypothetical protein [Aureibacter tunicatorum]MDR6240209.1 hypothetical protein [Aureibacter tunicatorum]BDD05910.1 hypothetical protein AUTU_33930 [Aureibacter tunicatorum]